MRPAGPRPFRLDSRGFTLAEVMVASMVLLIALLVIATMFPQGYQQVTSAGKMTLGVTAARQILEDMGALPFASLANLNGYTTTNPGTLPAANPERAVARRWAFMAAGNTNGFAFTSSELAEYGSFVPFGGQASVQVTTPFNGSQNQAQVAVTVSVPGLSSNVQITTVITRMF